MVWEMNVGYCWKKSTHICCCFCYGDTVYHCWMISFSQIHLIRINWASIIDRLTTSYNLYWTLWDKEKTFHWWKLRTAYALYDNVFAFFLLLRLLILFFFDRWQSDTILTCETKCSFSCYFDEVVLKRIEETSNLKRFSWTQINCC